MCPVNVLSNTLMSKNFFCLLRFHFITCIYLPEIINFHGKITVTVKSLNWFFLKIKHTFLRMVNEFSYAYYVYRHSRLLYLPVNWIIGHQASINISLSLRKCINFNVESTCLCLLRKYWHEITDGITVYRRHVLSVFVTSCANN